MMYRAGIAQSQRPKIDQRRLAPGEHSGLVLELLREEFRSDARGSSQDPEEVQLVATASATRASAGGAIALAGLVTIAAIHRTITAWFERHGCWLTAAGTDHGCSLCRSRTVAGTSTSLVVLLCHTARLATLWSRVTAFLKERLISSGEGKILPAIAASELYVAGHGSPRADCTAHCIIFRIRIS